MRAGGFLLILGLVGCVPSPALPDPITDGLTTDSSPAIESDQLSTPSGDVAPTRQPPSIDREALTSEATELVAEYLSITDEVTRAGGQGSDSINSVVTDAWASTEERGFEEYRSRGIRTIGVTEFDHLGIQSAHLAAGGGWEVAVFVCVDAQAVWVIPGDAPSPPDDLVAWLVEGQPEDEPTEQQATQWQEYIALIRPDAGQIDPVVMWLAGPTMTELRIDAIETWRGYHPCGPNDSPPE